MTTSPLNVAIVGCGNIAGQYARDIGSYPHLRLVATYDVDPARAEALAAEHGAKAYTSLDELLADPTIDLVANLTIHHAHYAVTKQILNAGKHVHSEKPLSMTVEEAQDLVALAKERGVRLGCSPFTWMGEAQQTAWNVLRSGKVGPVRLVYAEVNWGRIESWHPAPEPFYEVGALWDVGVYPLTLITTFLGPARKVWAQGKLLYPDRVTKEGRPFHISTPDFVLALIELESGATVRLTTNFYVKTTQQNSGVEFHGDLGTLHLAQWQDFAAWVGFGEFGKPLEEVPLIREAPKGTPWGRGVADLGAAILENRQHRATGEQAAHIVEILAAISSSIASGQAVEVTSSFPAPTPLDWALAAQDA